MSANRQLKKQYMNHKRHVRESFNAAAGKYDGAAVLQKEVGKRILERLDFIKHDPEVILDVGSGTGDASHALGVRYKKSQIISLDLAEAMLCKARSKNGWLKNTFGKQSFLCGDAESLPLADNSVDFIFSNLALQWCADLDKTFQEFKRVLKPEGLLLFSTFGPDTLKELRQSWRQADDQAAHVNNFLDMHDIGDALLRAGLADPVMDMENITLTYKDPYQLMRELKEIGAHTVNEGRRPGMTGKGRLKRMLDAYEQFRKDGVLPATYEVVYGHAWQGQNKQDVCVPISTLQRL